MRLSEAAIRELEYIKQQLQDHPDDEVEPTARYDALPLIEKEYIQKRYKELGGK